MKPRVEVVEDQATRAYFRRYGDSAQQPNRKATKVFEQDGKHYIRLSNVNGPLATYRITHRTGGGWRLSYADEKHEGEIQWPTQSKATLGHCMAVGRVLQGKDVDMGHDAQDGNERESAKSHQASVEIADALAKMFAELKPKIMAKYSLEDEQIILLAIAKAAVKLGTNSMQAGSLTSEQTEKLERKLQSIMLNAFMFGEVDDPWPRAWLLRIMACFEQQIAEAEGLAVDVQNDEIYKGVRTIDDLRRLLAEIEQK